MSNRPTCPKRHPLEGYFIPIVLAKGTDNEGDKVMLESKPVCKKGHNLDFFNQDQNHRDGNFKCVRCLAEHPYSDIHFECSTKCKDYYCMDCNNVLKKIYSCTKCSKVITNAAFGCEICKEHYCFELEEYQQSSCAEKKMKMELYCNKKHVMKKQVKYTQAKKAPVKCCSCSGKFQYNDYYWMEEPLVCKERKDYYCAYCAVQKNLDDKFALTMDEEMERLKLNQKKISKYEIQKLRKDDVTCIFKAVETYQDMITLLEGQVNELKQVQGKKDEIVRCAAIFNSGSKTLQNKKKAGKQGGISEYMCEFGHPLKEVTGLLESEDTFDCKLCEEGEETQPNKDLHYNCEECDEKYCGKCAAQKEESSDDETFNDNNNVSQAGADGKEAAGLNSFKTCSYFLDYLANQNDELTGQNLGWKTVSLATQGDDPKKEDILNNIRRHFFKFKKVSRIVMGYNGHGRVETKETKTNGGRCIVGTKIDEGGDEQVQNIHIEELLKPCIEKAASQEIAIDIELFLDCCGSNGAYFRLIDKLQKKEIDLTWVKNIKIYSPCAYDEVSFATDDGLGGKATFSMCHPDPEKRKNPFQLVKTFMHGKVDLYMCENDEENKWREKAAGAITAKSKAAEATEAMKYMKQLIVFNGSKEKGDVEDDQEKFKNKILDLVDRLNTDYKKKLIDRVRNQIGKVSAETLSEQQIANLDKMFKQFDKENNELEKKIAGVLKTTLKRAEDDDRKYYRHSQEDELKERQYQILQRECSDIFSHYNAKTGNSEKDAKLKEQIQAVEEREKIETDNMYSDQQVKLQQMFSFLDEQFIEERKNLHHKHHGEINKLTTKHTTQSQKTEVQDNIGPLQFKKQGTNLFVDALKKRVSTHVDEEDKKSRFIVLKLEEMLNFQSSVFQKDLLENNIKDAMVKTEAFKKEHYTEVNKMLENPDQVLFKYLKQRIMLHKESLSLQEEEFEESLKKFCPEEEQEKNYAKQLFKEQMDKIDVRFSQQLSYEESIVKALKPETLTNVDLDIILQILGCVKQDMDSMEDDYSPDDFAKVMEYYKEKILIPKLESVLKDAKFEEFRKKQAELKGEDTKSEAKAYDAKTVGTMLDMSMIDNEIQTIDADKQMVHKQLLELSKYEFVISSWKFREGQTQEGKEKTEDRYGDKKIGGVDIKKLVTDDRYKVLRGKIIENTGKIQVLFGDLANFNQMVTKQEEMKDKLKEAQIKFLQELGEDIYVSSHLEITDADDLFIARQLFKFAMFKDEHKGGKWIKEKEVRDIRKLTGEQKRTDPKTKEVTVIDLNKIQTDIVKDVDEQRKTPFLRQRVLDQAKELVTLADNERRYYQAKEKAKEMVDLGMNDKIGIKVKKLNREHLKQIGIIEYLGAETEDQLEVIKKLIEFEIIDTVEKNELGNNAVFDFFKQHKEKSKSVIDKNKEIKIGKQGQEKIIEEIILEHHKKHKALEDRQYNLIPKAGENQEWEWSKDIEDNYQQIDMDLYPEAERIKNDLFGDYLILANTNVSTMGELYLARILIKRFKYQSSSQSEHFLSNMAVFEFVIFLKNKPPTLVKVINEINDILAKKVESDSLYSLIQLHYKQITDDEKELYEYNKTLNLSWNDEKVAINQLLKEKEIAYIKELVVWTKVNDEKHVFKQLIDNIHLEDKDRKLIRRLTDMRYLEKKEPRYINALFEESYSLINNTDDDKIEKKPRCKNNHIMVQEKIEKVDPGQPEHFVCIVCKLDFKLKILHWICHSSICEDQIVCSDCANKSLRSELFRILRKKNPKYDILRDEVLLGDHKDKKLYKLILKETCIKSIWIDNNQDILRENLKFLMTCMQSFLPRFQHPKLFFCIRHVTGQKFDKVTGKLSPTYVQDNHNAKTEALLASLKVSQQTEYQDNLKKLFNLGEVMVTDKVKDEDQAGEQDDGYIGDLKEPSFEKNDNYISRHGFGIDSKITYSFYKVNQQHGLYYYESPDGGIYVGEKRGGQKYNFMIFDKDENAVFQWRDGNSVIPEQGGKINYKPEEWEHNKRSGEEEKERLNTKKEEKRDAKRIEKWAKKRDPDRSKSPQKSKSKSKSPGKGRDRSSSPDKKGYVSSSVSPDKTQK